MAGGRGRRAALFILWGSRRFYRDRDFLDSDNSETRIRDPMETECVSGVVAYPRVGWGGPGDSACDGGSCEFLRCQFVGIVACAGNTVPA